MVQISQWQRQSRQVEPVIKQQPQLLVWQQWQQQQLQQQLLHPVLQVPLKGTES